MYFCHLPSFTTNHRDDCQVVFGGCESEWVRDPIIFKISMSVQKHGSILGEVPLHLELPRGPVDLHHNGPVASPVRHEKTARVARVRSDAIRAVDGVII